MSVRVRRQKQRRPKSGSRGKIGRIRQGFWLMDFLKLAKERNV
jgi:hypothetical protein